MAFWRNCSCSRSQLHHCLEPNGWYAQHQEEKQFCHQLWHILQAQIFCSFNSEWHRPVARCQLTLSYVWYAQEQAWKQQIFVTWPHRIACSNAIKISATRERFPAPYTYGSSSVKGRFWHWWHLAGPIAGNKINFAFFNDMKPTITQAGWTLQTMRRRIQWLFPLDAVVRRLCNWCKRFRIT